MISHPDEKAKELVEKFLALGELHLHQAKFCALICVDEVLSLDVWYNPHNSEQGNLYWQQIKIAIMSYKR